MKFDVVERVADAVLDEEQFPIIAPRRSDDAGGEPWFSQTECLVKTTADTLVYVRARCLTLEDGRGVKRSADIIPIDVSREILRRISLGIDGLAAKIVIEVEPPTLDPPGMGNLAKLRLRLENHEAWRPEFAENRALMLARSLLKAHLLLGIDHGEIIPPLAQPPLNDYPALPSFV